MRGLTIAAATAAVACIGSIALGTHWSWGLLAASLFAAALSLRGPVAMVAALVAPVPLSLQPAALGAGLWWLPFAVAATVPFWWLSGAALPWRSPWALAAPMVAWIVVLAVYPETFHRSDIAPRAQVVVLAMTLAVTVAVGRRLPGLAAAADQRPRKR